MKKKKANNQQKVKIEVIGSVANTVTGSATLITFYDYELKRDIKILCDIGIQQDGTMYQNYISNLETLNRLEVKTLDYCLISHFHSDHALLLGALMNQGFKGKIIMTHESAQFIKVMLEDGLFIHRNEVESLGKKGYKVKEWYNEGDIQRVLNYTYEYNFDTEYQLSPNIKLKLLSNRHIMGSCSYHMWFTNESQVTKSLVFTGDLGNTQVDNYFTYKEQFQQINCNGIICESTYGNTEREVINKKLREEELKQIEEDIKYTLINKKGNVIFPCFSLQRSQVLLKIIKNIFDKNEELQKYKVVLDGRLSNLITDIYAKEVHSDEDKAIMQDLLEWKNLRREKEYKGTLSVIADEMPKVILTSQGFMQNGHSVTYAEYFVRQRRNTFIFTGFAPQGSLAYKIKKQEYKTVKVNNKSCEIRCDVREYHSFSSHIQFNQLIQLLTGGKIRDKIILIHGEKDGKANLKKCVEEKLSEKYKTTKVVIPKRNEIITL